MDETELARMRKAYASGLLHMSGMTNTLHDVYMGYLNELIKLAREGMAALQEENGRTSILDEVECLKIICEALLKIEDKDTLDRIVWYIASRFNVLIDNRSSL